jgi:hypothetical protein
VGTSGVGVIAIKKGTIPSSSPADEVQLYADGTDIAIDNMEYASDGAAQAAYVTDATIPEVIDQQQTSVVDSDYLGKAASGIQYHTAQSFQLSASLIITAIEIKCGYHNGSPTGNWTLRIETNNAGVPSGTLANANASIVVVPPGDGNIVKGAFASTFGLSASTTYWLVVACDTQTTDNYWTIDTNIGGYANGNQATSANGSWTTKPTYDLYFKIYVQGNKALQSYSESTIKTQGSYSLKGVALITDSNGKTLTRTVSPVIDLTGIKTLKFDIYASRTGANIKIGIRDSGLTVTEKTYTVLVTNTWETVTWDISAVADADKNAIDRIIITILNADAANTFYIDNFYLVGLAECRVRDEMGNITTISPHNFKNIPKEIS